MEYFDTYTEAGDYLGRQPRAKVHAEGIWHRTINIFLFNSGGELLLQQRSATKDVCPLHWDLSVAEHLQPGETDQAAAVRGLSEELGIKGVLLEPIGDVIRTQLEIPEQNIRDFEMTRCFKGVSDRVPVIDPEEVAGIEYVSVEVVAERLQNQPCCFTPWFASLVNQLGLIRPI